MKKYLIVFLSIALMNSSYAGTGVLGINPLHPIKSAKNVALGYTVSQLAVGITVSSTVSYLMSHPEILADWLSDNPTKVHEVTKYIDEKIKTNKIQSEKEKYIQLKNEIALVQDEQGAIFLESNKEWNELFVKIKTIIDAKDLEIEESGKMPKCTMAYVSKMLEDTKNFHNSINHILPYDLSNPAKSPNVSSYKILYDNYKKDKHPQKDKLQQDHIPSFAALNNFFNKNGYKTKTTVKLNKLGESITLRDKDLERNATAIAVPNDIHMLGRTYGGKNRFLHEEDSKNLKLATIKDITTTAFYFLINPQFGISADDYLKSGLILYERNKMLCLYNI